MAAGGFTRSGCTPERRRALDHVAVELGATLLLQVHLEVGEQNFDDLLVAVATGHRQRCEGLAVAFALELTIRKIQHFNHNYSVNLTAQRNPSPTRINKRRKKHLSVCGVK